MRLSAWLLFAVLSGALVCGAAVRPHYGGTLRVEMHAAPASLDPGTPAIAPLVFEPLVRLDNAGMPQPWLAVSWQRDANARRWQFRLRPGVKFHDGFVLAPASVVSSLQSALPGLNVAAAGDTIVIRADRSMPDLLLELADRAFISAQTADGGLVGTGPFRLTAWETGRHATLAAYNEYWGGRPFLDAIDIQMGRLRREQLLDLEIGKADVVEFSPADVRRAENSSRPVWSSANANLIALIFQRGHATDPRTREALALSLDRSAMYNVLLQKQGEISGALLPQWMSGYAFTFPFAPAIAQARALTGPVPPPSRTLTLAYDAAIPNGKSLAERVAVNARDAGLTVQVAQQPPPDLRLVEIMIRSISPSCAMGELAADLGLDAPPPSYSPEALYGAERRLLETFTVIPLFHIPEMYGVSARVHSGQPSPISRLGGWHFEAVWLSAGAP
ncbi:MAG: ABC transporter substrate-binding protein [Bryobacteraceae bacterium]